MGIEKINYWRRGIFKPLKIKGLPYLLWLGVGEESVLITFSFISVSNYLSQLSG